MLETSLEPTRCPYCGEPIDLVVDPSVAQQDYVEDCAVCCRPMRVEARIGQDGGVSVTVRREDEA